ncbi:MAG: TolC family protein, partial [Muribaculaceae bacterium]|nr:TolC family protein [Muribaculaceae bacterium]
TENVLDQKMKIIKAAYLPQINLIAGDNLKGPITYEIPVVNANINTWYLGVGLNFNIGNIYRLPKETSRLKSAMLQNRNELSEAEENTELDVRAAQIRYLDSFELLKTQEKSLQLARENYDITANRYANDLVLIIDLVDADNLRLNAEVQYENAKINIAYAYYKLLYTAGILNSQNL